MSQFLQASKEFSLSEDSTEYFSEDQYPNKVHYMVTNINDGKEVTKVVACILLLQLKIDQT